VYINYCAHKVERKLVRTSGVAMVDLGYDILGEACGEGTFGTVFPALLRNGDKNAGGDLVVVKHVKLDSPELPVSEAEMREVQILQKFQNMNVVKLISAQRTPYALDLIFEHCDSDLRAVMRHEKKTNSQTRSYVAQLLSGVVYIHAQGVIHRDLKPANVLVKQVPYGVVLKIADFGMARDVLASGSMTPRVCTLWYRAPELLLGATRYTTAVDIWSLGCICVELMDGDIAFAGTSDIDMLFKIFRTFGTPDASRWEGLTRLPHFSVTKFPKFKPNVPKWGAQFGSGAREFIQGLINPCPKGRWSAEQAAKHSIGLLHERQC
jgi:serine/threonine protein kinase